MPLCRPGVRALIALCTHGDQRSLLPLTDRRLIGALSSTHAAGACFYSLTASRLFLLILPAAFLIILCNPLLLRHFKHLCTAHAASWDYACWMERACEHAECKQMVLPTEQLRASAGVSGLIGPTAVDVMQLGLQGKC